MMAQERVVARVNGPSGKIFPHFAQAVISLVADGDVTHETGVSMLIDLITQYATSDPDRWHEPPMEIARKPVVFEALQWARLRLMS